MDSDLHRRLENLSAKLERENEERRHHDPLVLDEELKLTKKRVTLSLDELDRDLQSPNAPLRPNAMSSGSSSFPCLRPPAPARHGRRKKLDLPLGGDNGKQPNRSKQNIEKQLQEITKNALMINGKCYPPKIDDLEWIEEMGSGTCGVVNKMKHKKTKTIMAVKKMGRSSIVEEEKRILMDLDVVMKCNDCPFIVQSFGAFTTQSDVYICMELMGTCFEKLLRKTKQAVPECILGKMSSSVLRALQYLKERHEVMHRDVKPSNILLDSAGRIKLCDFGISGRLVDSKAKTRGAGCAAYMAPERIEPPDPENPKYDIRADVWSLGISLIELATGEFPYKGCCTEFEVLSMVMNYDPPSLPSSMSFSEEFRQFTSICLTKDYRKRPKFDQLLEHEFIAKYNKEDIDVASWYSDVMKLMR